MREKEGEGQREGERPRVAVVVVDVGGREGVVVTYQVRVVSFDS